MFSALLVLLALSATELPRSVPLPIGVADRVDAIGYVPGTGGTLDAISLDTGKILWSTKTGARPLLAIPTGVVALAADKPGRILILGSKDGKEVLRSSPLKLPDWVRLTSAPGCSFKVDASLDEKGLLLRWEARTWYAGGAAPTPEIEKQAKKNASGAFRIDLKDGKVEALDSVPALVMSLVATLEVEKTKAGEKLLMHRLDAKGQRIATSELGVNVTARLTLDGGHYLVHPSDTEKAGSQVGVVFSILTGKPVGKAAIAPGNDATVVAARAYGIGAGRTQRTLRAFDLKTEKMLWEHLLPTVPMLPPRPAIK